MNDELASGAPPGEDFATACSTDIELYLHPLLEEPPLRSRVDAATWAEYEALVARARESCSRCPILTDCLYKAVVHVDVSGYVGCTTPKERAAMRRVLDVSIEAEDLDAVSGARGSRQPVDHAAVLAMRAAHPDDPLEQIANRLGCSLSTVKRHMRRARRADADADADAEADAEAKSKETGEPVPREPAELPSLDEVFDAFDEVVEPRLAPGR